MNIPIGGCTCACMDMYVKMHMHLDSRQPVHLHGFECTWCIFTCKPTFMIVLICAQVRVLVSVTVQLCTATCKAGLRIVHALTHTAMCIALRLSERGSA